MSYSSLIAAITVYESSNGAGKNIARRKNRITSSVGSNPKLAQLGHIDADKFAILSLSLAPAKSSGIDICPGRSASCTAGCLGHNSGHSVMGSGCANNADAPSPVRLARIRRTQELFGMFGPEVQLSALRAIDTEIGNFIRYCKKLGISAAVRLNAFSDICWEVIWPELFKRHFKAQFYDYTKLSARLVNSDGIRKVLPSNYYLTFSRSEDNETKAVEMLSHGFNVAVVFGCKKVENMPSSWKGYPTINGAAHDMRFLDPAGSVVALPWKGPASKSEYAKSLNHALVTLFAVSTIK